MPPRPSSRWTVYSPPRRSSIIARRSLLMLSRDRLVERVPAVRRGDARFQLGYDLEVAAVGHDRDTVALPHVGLEVAQEAPVSAAVGEVPAFALLLERESHREGPDTRRCQHFLHSRL